MTLTRKYPQILIAGHLAFAVIAFVALSMGIRNAADAAMDNPSAVIETEARIGFNEQVRPILAQHCISCHGPDEEHRSADVRLDVREGALDVIQPNDPDASELFARIASEDDDRMPPPDHGAGLNADEVEVIRKWILQGADYETHWSFQPLVQPEVPAPSVDGWGRNEIDRFVAAQVSSAGLVTSADGDLHRLIRRLALDLTGLPPSKKMVDNYAADPTEENYETIVDQLLDSRAYGEHWAAMWMDIARYADTMGYAEDKKRDIWPWRDWVIRAFNDNMPWDEFTIEQIAGDLLPNATETQKLATAFHRNTLSNTEGGTNDEEFRVIAVKDRISTTINVWMGLTMRCAECHTHKYDPISQTEYYQFFDYFNQTVDSDARDERPRLKTFPPEKAALLNEVQKKAKALREKIESEPEVWKILSPSTVKSRHGAKLKVLDDDSVLASGKNPRFDQYEVDIPLPEGTISGLRLEVFPEKTSGRNVGRGHGGAFVLSHLQAQLIKGAEVSNLKFSDAKSDYAQPRHELKNVIGDQPAKQGWAVRHPVDGYQAKRTGVLELAEPLQIESPSSMRLVMSHQSPYPGLNIARFRISATAFSKPVDAFKKEELDPLRWKLEQLEKELNGHTLVPVMEELAEDKRRETFVNIRGSYTSKGDKVEASVPAAFHKFPQSAPANRYGVAQWLMADENPLTARVTVNRFWARLFGIGIVETEEDFGTQGAVPVNRDLLDWLAVDFRDNGWDVKRLLKQMVMSSAYRQDNRATPEQLAKDARNRLLARGPRFRLSAEVVRDQALAVSGLLSQKFYGPPVFPNNAVKSVRNAFTGGMKWEASPGEDRYRRALYTFLKRSSPHPLFETFDMSSRTVCNMRRIRTNTPLQSFMTLNDVTFIEAAQALAQQMLESSDNSQEQIRRGLEQALLHPARGYHLQELTELYESLVEDYSDDFLAAAKLVKRSKVTSEEKGATVRLASMTVVANVILNLDEFLTR